MARTEGRAGVWSGLGDDDDGDDVVEDELSSWFVVLVGETRHTPLEEAEPGWRSCF